MGKRYIKIYSGDEMDMLYDNGFSSLLDECFKKEDYPVTIEHYNFENGEIKKYSSDGEFSSDNIFDPSQDQLLILWNLYWKRSEEESRKAQINQIQKWISEGGKIFITAYCTCSDNFAMDLLGELRKNLGKKYVASRFENYLDDAEIMKQYAKHASLKIIKFFDNELAFDGESESNKPAKLAMKPNQS